MSEKLNEVKKPNSEELKETPKDQLNYSILIMIQKN